MNVTNMTTPLQPSGYLELILGPMFSGKSTRLVEIYNQCMFCDIPVVAINHAIDTRYDDEHLSTHDYIKIPCVKASKLSDIWKPDIKGFTDKRCSTAQESGACLILKYSKVILINEGQFFDDLFEVVSDMVRNGKQVYVCGLDGDFQRKKFGQMLDLVPLCDSVVKLASLCSLCKNGAKGIFSVRLTHETEQTVVGTDYIPVCRACFHAKHTDA